MDLQELITRGRFLMADAPGRLRVFELVDGRRTAGEIAALAHRPANAVRNDLRTLQDGELIRPRTAKDGSPSSKEGSIVFEKVPLARTVKASLFQAVAPRPARPHSPAPSGRREGRASRPIPIPSEAEILAVCTAGEDQMHEFKRQGTDARKIAKEVAAFLTTRDGGLLLYGVDDDGTIQGSDIPRAQLDQSVQNAVRNSISPAPHITLNSVRVLGSEVIVIRVPPWNRRDVYQYEGRVLTRKGTNVFQVIPDEAKELHRGQYIN